MFEAVQDMRQFVADCAARPAVGERVKLEGRKAHPLINCLVVLLARVIPPRLANHTVNRFSYQLIADTLHENTDIWKAPLSLCSWKEIYKCLASNISIDLAGSRG